MSVMMATAPPSAAADGVSWVNELLVRLAGGADAKPVGPLDEIIRTLTALRDLQGRPESDDDAMIPIAEVAKMYGVSVRQAWRLPQLIGAPAGTLVSRNARRWRRGDIKAFIRSLSEGAAR
jgi:hypothetical protein